MGQTLCDSHFVDFSDQQNVDLIVKIGECSCIDASTGETHMTRTTHRQRKPLFLKPNGHDEVKIASGSAWIVEEGSDYTQIFLDRHGHILDGMGICLDWSQISAPMPSRKFDRIAAIIDDLSLLSSHAEIHMEEAASA
jgi:hypothetical protein